MAAIGSIPCPGRCGRSIRLIAATASGHTGLQIQLQITVDELDLRRHALCMTPTPDGEPLRFAA